jgi:hypothetical protein
MNEASFAEVKMRQRQAPFTRHENPDGYPEEQRATL